MKAKLATACFACLLLGSGPVQEQATIDVQGVQGVWKPVSVMFGRSNLIPESDLKQVTVQFEQNQFEVLLDGKQLLDMKYFYHVNDSAFPATFEMIGQKGEKAFGIFRCEQDELTLVLVEKDHTPPTDFANPTEFKVVLKRIK